MLLNNLAFALASSEHVAEARAVFARIPRALADKATSVTLIATEGLLEYRGGNAPRGRQLYKTAFDGALELGLKKQAALAAAYLAREEMRLGAPGATEAVARASESASSADCEEARLILSGVEAAGERGQVEGQS